MADTNGVTVDTDELEQLADDQNQAAAKAASGAQATENIDHSELLWVTHGVVSAQSNLAITAKTDERETAQILYTTTDTDTAEGLDDQMQT